MGFLTREQRQRYGNYDSEPTPMQLARYFHLDDTDKNSILIRRGNHNRLGFALQLVSVRFLGTFLENPIDVPSGVVIELATQLGITNIDCLPQYLERPFTHWEHRAEIKQRYGYRDFSEQPGHWQLVRWLYGRAWVGSESPSVLFDLATARLVEHKVLLPGVTVLERLVVSVRERAANRLWRVLSQIPSDEQRLKLEALLVSEKENWYTPLDQLRKSPTRHSSPALVSALNRLVTIRSLGINALDFSHIPAISLKALARHAATIRVQAIARMPEQRRIATVLAFVRVLEAEAGDDILDLLALLVKDLLISSVRDGKKEWSNPHAKLLQGSHWESARPQVCRTLNLQQTPEAELSQLKQQLDEAFHRTANNLPSNTAIQIEATQKGNDTFTISNLDKLEEPDSLKALKKLVARLLPRIDLPEALLEIHTKTGFMDEFIHGSLESSRVEDLPISICAVLVAQSCNIGLKPLARNDIPALTRNRLAWIQQNYLRSETLLRANARLVDAQTQIPLAQTWGGGDVASADGLRFVVPVQTLNSGPNRKYFGRGRGITYYNFVSDQFTGFHALVVPGTLRDSLVVLVGLLEQQTSLSPKEVMTDTAGYSDVVFGLFWLLGYQFSPRLADVGEARFWRLDQSANYGALDGIARQRVNISLIENHWDDMLRVAGSLKLGMVSAIDIMRTLSPGDKPSVLGRAIGELGRIAKTLYLLNYVDDEAYRRRILTQLNRGEGRHALARVTFYGQKGELRQRYREGQEDQLSALGLVVNALILWNTYYMDEALTSLQAQGVNQEDVARLSPLGHAHINMLGRYQFSLPPAVIAGKMRPLRDPNDTDEQDE
jgi:TnpA family transposase